MKVRRSSSSAGYSAFISYSHEFDGKFAPTLQRALQRFAKPWYRARALKVFRDQTSLSANPALWPSIEAALDQSEFFVLLASPQAAKSVWVGREVEYWCDHKPREKLLLAVTSGEVGWDSTQRDFDPDRATAVPGALRNRYDEEPRYVDFAWVRGKEQLSLRHPQFRECVADLAAPMHHLPKDELIGEEVRQHRRTLWIVRLTALVLLGLTAAAVISAIRANNFADEARAERDRAQEQLRLATARYLGGRAQSERGERYAQALFMSLASLEIRDSSEGRRALLANLERSAQLHLFWRVAGEGSSTSIAFSPEGELVASAGDSDDVTVWDPASRTVTCKLFKGRRGLDLSSAKIAISSRGLLALSGWDRIRFGDPATCERRGPTMPAGNFNGPIAFSPEGGLLASPVPDGRVALWDVDTGRVKRYLRVPPADGGVGNLAFSPDRRTLAAGLRPQGVVLLDYRSGQMLGPLRPASAGAQESLAFAPDGELLATGDDRGQVTLYGTPGRRRLATLHAGASRITDLEFSVDGQRLAAASTDGLVRVWRLPVPRGEPVALSGHDATVDTLAFAPQGNTLLSGGRDGSMVEWGLRRGHRLVDVHKVSTEAVKVIEPRPGTTQIAFGGLGRVWLSDVRSRERVGSLRLGSPSPVTSLAFSRRLGRVAAGTETGYVAAWRLRDGRLLGSPRRLHKGAVTGMSFSQDGEIVASGGQDGRVLLLRPRSGEIVAERRVIREPVAQLLDDIQSVELSPDGDRLAAASLLEVALWGLGGPGRAVRRLRSDVGALADASFSRGGNVLTVSGSEGVVLWDIRRGPESSDQLPLRGRPVETAEIAADGTVVAGLVTAETAPDGTELPVRSTDGLALWDRRGGRLGSLEAPVEAVVESWAISPDGRRAVAGTDDGRLLVWNLDPRYWRAQGCSIVRRNLTRVEWARLVGRGVEYRRICD